PSAAAPYSAPPIRGAAPNNPGFPPPSAAAPYSAPPLRGAAPNNPGFPPPSAAASYPYSARPGASDVYAASYPYPPAIPGMTPYVPASVPRQQEKPIRFPLTRKAPALLQSFGMLLYGLMMIICIMGCTLTLLREYVNNASVYFHVNGSLNVLSVLI